MIQRITTCPAPEEWRARVLANISETETGCWQWTGPLDRHGYGRFGVRIDGRKRHTGSHRASWLAFRGDIDGKLVIDHLCRNIACVNPDHLEPVTNAENTRRGDHSGKLGRSGHATAWVYTCATHGQEDGYIVHLGEGRRKWTCRPCRRARVAAWKARNAAA